MHLALELALFISGGYIGDDEDDQLTIMVVLIMMTVTVIVINIMMLVMISGAPVILWMINYFGVKFTRSGRRGTVSRGPTLYSRNF